MKPPTIRVVGPWAPHVTDQSLERLLANRDEEVRLMAEVGGEPVGIGAVVVSEKRFFSSGRRFAC